VALCEEQFGRLEVLVNAVATSCARATEELSDPD
jgi:hypothetical protein